jgi:hypothetical protein
MRFIFLSIQAGEAVFLSPAISIETFINKYNAMILRDHIVYTIVAGLNEALVVKFTFVIFTNF